MTSLPAFATIEDLADRRPSGVSVADRPRAQAALVDASNLIRAETNKTWVDDTNQLDAVPPIFLTITCRSALRAFDNPDAIQSEAITNYSVTLANASADVYLTKTERALIRKAAGLGGVFALATTRSDAVGLDTANVGCGDGTVYLPVEPQPGEPIAWNDPDW